MVLASPIAFGAWPVAWLRDILPTMDDCSDAVLVVGSAVVMSVDYPKSERKKSYDLESLCYSLQAQFYRCCHSCDNRILCRWSCSRCSPVTRPKSTN